MRTYLVVDPETLDEAVRLAGPKDKIVVAEGAFDKTPRLELENGRWRLVEDPLLDAIRHWDLA